MDNIKPWHEDDSFWETWAFLMFSEQRIKDAVNDIDRITRLCNLTPNNHILDLCCGIGRHSLELARRGFTVTGVDRTAYYLTRARNQAEKEKLKIEFIQSDMRSFSRQETFDVVLSMFTSFGYFENINDDRKTVTNVRDSLKPGGVFIIDTHGKETLARIFQPKMWTEQDGVIWLQEQKVSQNWSWMQSHWILIRDNKRVESDVSHRLYAATEMIALLAGCGFSRVDIYGDLDGNPYDHTARRLITVGRK